MPPKPHQSTSGSGGRGGAGAGGQTLLQQQQARRALQKEQQPVISCFLWAFRSAVVALKLRRCQAILLIQDEYRAYLERAGPSVHTARQRRKVQRRSFILSVDGIIRAAVQNGRRICFDESNERRSLFLSFVSVIIADTERREEVSSRRSIGAEQDEARERLVEQLMANVPHEAVPGTFEYDEFQMRCHVIRLEKFARTIIVQASVSPKADMIEELECGRRRAFVEQELRDRIDLVRTARCHVAGAELFDLERLEARLRTVAEEERAIAFAGMGQHRALTSMFLLLGPGAFSEHDERIALFVEHDRSLEFLFRRMLEERTMLLCSDVVAAEQKERMSRRGIPAVEAHERCQILVRLYDLRLVLLQGEFSANDGLYVSSEAGSRRAIRWAEQRERDAIYKAAAATIFVALVPIEEVRGRERVAAAQAEQASLLILQKLPVYFQQVLEPAARRNIFRDWFHFARRSTLNMFNLTLQAMQESGRVFLQRAAVINMEHLAGCEYLEFLQLKHRALVIKEARSRQRYSVQFARQRQAQQQQEQQQQFFSPHSHNSNYGDPYDDYSAADHQHASPFSVDRFDDEFETAAFGMASNTASARNKGPLIPPPFVVKAAEEMTSSPKAKR